MNELDKLREKLNQEAEALYGIHFKVYKKMLVLREYAERNGSSIQEIYPELIADLNEKIDKKLKRLEMLSRVLDGLNGIQTPQLNELEK